MSGTLHFSHEQVERSQFDNSCQQAATVLQEAGLVADDVIAILLRNEPNYVRIIEACRYLGLRYVALNWHGSAKEIQHILEDSHAKLIIGHSDLLQGLSQRDLPSTLKWLSIPTPPSIVETYKLAPSNNEHPNFLDLLAQAKAYNKEPEKLRGLFAYTSGSTGRPKGINRPSNPDGPDRYMMYPFLAASFMFLQEGDSFYMAAPMYHSAPNTLCLSAYAAQKVDIFIEPQFDPEGFLQALEQHKITHAYIVPTMMIRLLKLPEEVRARYDVSSLRYAVSTGSPCPVEVKQAMIDWFGPVFYESYGASELGFMTLIGSEDAQRKPGSVGKAREGTQIKILNDELQVLPAGESGTIYIYSELASGFSYSNSEGDLSDQNLDGFATVGDIGYLDEEGFLFISDRKKDMIISGGANIFPAEIEAEILKLDEVLDCAVFSAPDPEFGESIVAAVQLKTGVSLNLEQLQQRLDGHLARFKMPRKLDLHDSLPREDSGKIFKQRLKAPYWEKQGRAI